MTTKQVRLRRGTTQQHQTFTGAQGELTVDTDKKTVRVHDGVTPAGVPLATEQFVEDSFVGITQGPVGPQGPAGTTDYNQLVNKPDLAPVATSGSYTDLTDKPTYATVASTGSFYDLVDIPDEVEQLVWVGSNGSDDLSLEGRGNALLPFLTIQAAVDYLDSESGGAVLVAPGYHLGNVTINTDKPIAIKGFDASHTKKTILVGRVIVQNGNSNFSINSLDIAPGGNHTAIDLQAFSTVSFESCTIEAENATSTTDLIKIQGSGGVFVGFENCTITEGTSGGINITNTNPLLTVQFDNMQGNPAIEQLGACRVIYSGSFSVGNVHAAGIGPVQLSSVSQVGNVLHESGSIIIANVSFIQSVTSTVNAGLGYSFNLATVNFLRPNGTYSPLVKSGTCAYTITNSNYDMSTAVIAGQRRSYGTLTGDIGRTVKLVTAATHQCSGSDEELLVNHAGDCVITLPNPGINGMKIKIRDISGNIGKIKKIYSVMYGINRPGLSIKIQVADGSNHKIAGRDYDADYIFVPAPNSGREFIFFNNKWYLENLNSLTEDSWWPVKLAGVEFIDTYQPGDDLGGYGLIPFSKGRSAWDLELGAYSSDHIDRSYFMAEDTSGTPKSWSRIWLSNRGAIIGGQMYSGASLTLAGATLNIKSPLDITTPNGLSVSNLHVTPSNLWEYSRVTIDSGLSYSNTTRLDFTNSRGGTRWIAVGGKRQGGQYTFSPDTTGIWRSTDGINFTPVSNPFDDTGANPNIVTVAHISTGGVWGTLLAASNSNRYFRSTDGGDTWIEITPSGIGAPTVGQYYFQRKLFGAGTRFYLLESRNIYQSLDSGITWTNVVPTEVTLDDQIQLNDMAYNPTSNTIIAVGGRWDPSSFGWKGSYAIRSNLTAQNETQWTTIINSNEGGILSVASTTDYDNIDRWGMVRQKSWNDNIYGWGVAAQLWNEGNRFTTVQFSKKLSTVIPDETNGNKEIPWWESALGRQAGGAGWTNHPAIRWEDPNFWTQDIRRSVMCMDRTGTPVMFIAEMEWLASPGSGGEGGGGESTSVVTSHIYTVPDKAVVNPHEDLTDNVVSGSINALAVHQSGVNLFVVADGDFATYAAGRSVSSDGRNWQTWWSLAGYYDETDPQLQGEQYAGLQRAPVFDIIAIDSTDITQTNEALVASISAEPSQGTFRIQGKQVGSAVMIDTRDVNGTLSYNLACYDNKVYAKNLTLDGSLTSMSNVINLDNLTYANVGLGLKGQYGIYHNPTGTAISVPASTLVTLATYNELFTTVKYLVSAYSDDGVHSQTSEILISGLMSNINNPNGTVTSVTNNGGPAWLAFGIVRNPNNILEIQIVCAASYSCKVSILPIMMISPSLA